jgi:hypothetical protein
MDRSTTSPPTKSVPKSVLDTCADFIFSPSPEKENSAVNSPVRNIRPGFKRSNVLFQDDIDQDDIEAEIGKGGQECIQLGLTQKRQRRIHDDSCTRDDPSTHGDDTSTIVDASTVEVEEEECIGDFLLTYDERSPYIYNDEQLMKNNESNKKKNSKPITQHLMLAIRAKRLYKFGKFPNIEIREEAKKRLRLFVEVRKGRLQ